MSGPVPGTPTPWEVDTIQSEGEYGSGPDTIAGFAVSAIYDTQGRALFDALNSDAIEVHEDGPDECGFYSAWDAVSAANAATIVHRVNNWDALETELAALKATNAALVEVLQMKRDYVRDCANGFLTYPDSGDGFKAMAAEDLARIDAALAKGDAA